MVQLPYYLEGAFWSVSQAPHMDGIFYDGINFDRRGMRRLRKVLDRASVGKKFPPLVDIHTGNGPRCLTCRTFLTPTAPGTVKGLTLTWILPTGWSA